MAGQCTQEDMLTYTAQLRAQASAKEKLQSQQEFGPRQTDMSIGEALEEIATTMQADKFWVDLAKPLDAARAALAEGQPPSGAARKRAAELMRACMEQVVELKHYFQTELAVLEKAAKVLEDDAKEASLETLLPSVKTTRSPETEAALAKGNEDNSREDKAMKAAEGPFEFIETKDKSEVTVNVPVPAATSKTDIKVTFRERSITVKVAGHRLQPAVIDDELAGKVDPDGCAWTLEGSGDGRRLVLELEKQMGGIMWNRLLAISR